MIEICPCGHAEAGLSFLEKTPFTITLVWRRTYWQVWCARGQGHTSTHRHYRLVCLRAHAHTHTHTHTARTQHTHTHTHTHTQFSFKFISHARTPKDKHKGTLCHSYAHTQTHTRAPLTHTHLHHTTACWVFWWWNPLFYDFKLEHILYISVKQNDFIKLLRSCAWPVSSLRLLLQGEK
jgi:hypothetical protein